MPPSNQPTGVKYLCPACHAEVEVPEQAPDQTSPCPSCGEAVHFRRKLYLKPVVGGMPVFPERAQRRRVVVLAILVIFAGLVVAMFFKMKSVMQ